MGGTSFRQAAWLVSSGTAPFGETEGTSAASILFLLMVMSPFVFYLIALEEVYLMEPLWFEADEREVGGIPVV
jgi:hypothetical protein